MQERLLAAAKARLTRMMTPKTKRKDLEPPQNVKDYWFKNNKTQVAEIFRDLNFNRESCAAT